MSLGLRHVEKRRKARVSGFPTKKTILRDSLDILIYPIALGGPLAMLPQVIKLYSEKSAAGLAFSTWFLFLCFNLVWFVYGMVHKDRPIILTNTVLASLNFAVVMGILIYG